MSAKKAMAVGAAPPKKTRNYAIDFWRVWCTLAVALMHFHEHGEWDGFLTAAFEKMGTYPFFYRGGLLLEFFLLTGGYFFVASYKSKQRRGLAKGKSAADQAWGYAKSRFQAFWPPLLLSAVFALAVKCALNGATIIQWFTTFCVNVWEFTGLAETGAMGSPVSLGGNWQNNWDFDPARVMAANYPAWYISGLIITAATLYFLLAENEGRFRCVWAPLITVVYLAAFGFNEPSFTGTREQTILGLPVNVLWVAGGLCMGALLWYLVDWLKRKTYTPGEIRGMTVIHFICTAFLIFASVSNFFQYNADVDGSGYYNEQIFTPAMATIIVLCMLNKDRITKLLNWPILGKLGEYSLYFFLMHYPTIMIATWVGRDLVGTESYWVYLTTYLVLASINGLILMLLCKKWLIPATARFLREPEPPADASTPVVEGPADPSAAPVASLEMASPAPSAPVAPELAAPAETSDQTGR